MSGILPKLEARFGRHRVIDVFENTGMALRAQELSPERISSELSCHLNNLKAGIKS